jgi:hypothetical protein
MDAMVSGDESTPITQPCIITRGSLKGLCGCVIGNFAPGRKLVHVGGLKGTYLAIADECLHSDKE